MKIISLIPGATETLCELGLADHLVGISHECDFPEHINNRTRITQSAVPKMATSKEIHDIVSTLNLNGQPLYQVEAESLRRASPDLIITQDLCSVCAISPGDLQHAIAGVHPRPEIISLNAATFNEVLSDIAFLGSKTGAMHAATQLVDRIKKRLSVIDENIKRLSHRPRAVLLEWLNPPFAAGHWTPSLIEYAGGHELIGKANCKSVRITWESLYAAEPEHLILACCGRSIEQTKQEIQSPEIIENLLKLECVQKGNLYLMDGSAYFNRPGPRLIDAIEMLASLFHPTIGRELGLQPAFEQIELSQLN